MLAFNGYYDGAAVRPLEKMDAKPNQRVIITVMDEFIEPQEENARSHSLRGVLAQFADHALAEKEKAAWERAAVEKHVDP